LEHFDRLHKILYTPEHEKALKMINSYWEEGEKLDKSLERLLDKDDPIISRFGMVNVVLMNLSSAIKNELDTGVLIDPEDLILQQKNGHVEKSYCLFES